MAAEDKTPAPRSPLGRDTGHADPRGWRLEDVLRHTPPGWHSLARACWAVAQEHGVMTAQAKEKVGSYRYYTHDWGWPEVVEASDALRDAWRRIRAITTTSGATCQVCGAPGKRHVHDHWYATLCSAHAVAWMIDGRGLLDLYREAEGGSGGM